MVSCPSMRVMGASRQYDMSGKDSAARGRSCLQSEASIALDLLISFQRGITPEKFRINALRCYDTLLLALEKAEYSARLARLGRMHPRMVKICALKIVDMLLFNAPNDPFLSLGLPGNASSDAIHRRWKRLVVLFHPDRPAAAALDVKRTKTINVAYQRIRETLQGRSPANEGLPGARADGEEYSLVKIASFTSSTFAEAVKTGWNYFWKAFYAINDLGDEAHRRGRGSYERDGTSYLRYLPSIIVILTAFAAMVMLSLYILQSLFSFVGRMRFG